MLLSTTGCASLGRRGPVPEDVAQCRELTRQGVAAIESGRWAEAEAVLRQASEASPGDAEARRYLAEVLWHRGAANEACTEIEAAVGNERSDAALRVRAGEMLLATGDPHRALRHAERAIGIDPKLASAWALRGRVFWQLNQGERALADLQRSLHYAPTRTDVLFDLAALYRQRGQPQRCLTTLQQLLDAHRPGDEPQLALLLEGLTLTELGRHQQAVESLLAASQRGPESAEVLYRLAQAQLAAGDAIGAADSVQQALVVDGAHLQSRELHAQLASHSTPDEHAVR